MGENERSERGGDVAKRNDDEQGKRVQSRKICANIQFKMTLGFFRAESCCLAIFLRPFSGRFSQHSAKYSGELLGRINAT